MRSTCYFKQTKPEASGRQAAIATYRGLCHTWHRHGAVMTGPLLHTLLQVNRAPGSGPR